MVQALAATEPMVEAIAEPAITQGWLRMKLPESWETSDEAWDQLGQENPEWEFELSADGELIILAGESPESSERGTVVITDIGIWKRSTGLGRVYGPALRTRLSDGSILIPDAAWMSEQRWSTRNRERPGSLDVCPELIVEIASPSDEIMDLQLKMELWIENGALLGWLIDPFARQVWIYRPQREPEVLREPAALLGENVCVGLSVSLVEMWSAAEGDRNVASEL